MFIQSIILNIAQKFTDMVSMSLEQFIVRYQYELLLRS